MAYKRIEKKDRLRTEVLHQVFMNLGYETAASRTLRECGIDDIDINSILVRAGVLPRGTMPVRDKYDRMMTIKEFINQVVGEYGNESKQ